MKAGYHNIVRYASIILILLSFVIELNMLSFSDRSKILSVLYGLFIVLYLFIFTMFRLRFPSAVKVLLIFIVYLSFLSFFSSNKVVTYNYMAKFTFGLLYFVTGYNFFYRKEDIRMLGQSALVVLTIGLVIAFYNNFIQQGISLYDNDFFGQSLATTYNTFAILICIMLVFSFNYSPRQIYYSVFLAFLTLILLFLVFKRSPLLILILAASTTLLFNADLFKVNSKMRRSLVLILLILIISYPFYEKKLSENLHVRQAAFQSKIEEQPRYKENLGVFQKISDDPVSLLFGTGEVFNSKGQIIYRDRMLHTDYANILWGGGVVGFVVYFGFFINLLVVYIKTKRKSRKSAMLNDVSFAGIIIVQSYFACALSQAWTSISVMSLVMVVCGATYGYIRNGHNEQTISKHPQGDLLKR
jgi:hypothetical protein